MFQTARSAFTDCLQNGTHLIDRPSLPHRQYPDTTVIITTNQRIRRARSWARLAFRMLSGSFLMSSPSAASISKA